MFFWKLWLASFTPKVQIIHKNAITFFFLKMHILLYHIHLPQVFTIQNIVIAINTPTTMNNQFEALNAPKNRFTLFLSQFLWTKKKHLFTFFPYSSKKTQDFDSKIFIVHRAIETYYSWWVTFVWDSGCLEKTFVC